ncbi:MAG: glutamine synthetase family protein [Eubacteriales bacterium]|nr:glutamine synthetase family protein [Eubacteriales bacterium]
MKRFTANEVMQFVRENDVKFVRLAFCDVFGTLKNISVLADQLPRAFEYGVAFDGAAISGFDAAPQPDLFLFPLPSTLVVLPWRPQQGRVIRLFCEIRCADGSPFIADTRNMLKDAVARVQQAGLACKIGPACTFYLFESDENGYSTRIPHDRAGYLDVSPLDRGENVRREICLTLEEMGIRPETSRHQQGPGQHEIDFAYSGALEAADNVMTLRTVIDAVALRNGLCASFLPQPCADAQGNALHVNLSLLRDGQNLFGGGAQARSATAEHFLAGVLRRAREMTLFLSPLDESYTRLGAPCHVGWSRQDRAQMARIPASADPDRAHMQVRSPDPSCNPYVAFALLLYAGLEGVAQQPALDAPLDAAAGQLARENLPASRAEAIECARNSAFVARVMPASVIASFCQPRQP